MKDKSETDNEADFGEFSSLTVLTTGSYSAQLVGFKFCPKKFSFDGGIPKTMNFALFFFFFFTFHFFFFDFCVWSMALYSPDLRL